jgi:hypothetical protein
MQKSFFLIITCLFFLSAKAQYGKSEATAPAKDVFFEIGGPGVASINYDMRFTKSESGIGGRIGFGGFCIGSSGDRATALFIPIGINYLLGKDGKHYFELGGGVTPVIINSSSTAGTSDNFRSTFGHLNIGYRMQPSEGGFFFRATINPVFGKGFFWPYYGGVSFGYKF